ncbi:hypothetical protein ACIOEW_36055 [Streptomyces sp. NPDC087901]
MIYRYGRCPDSVTVGHQCLLLVGLGGSIPIEVVVGPSQEVGSG